MLTGLKQAFAYQEPRIPYTTAMFQVMSLQETYSGCYMTGFRVSGIKGGKLCTCWLIADSLLQPLQQA